MWISPGANIMRRSRRLRGLAPEEQAIEQVCFICQLRIHVNHLGRCVSTPCCHVFMHRSCYNNMVERLPTCGNCREPNVDHVPDETDTIILETDEELDVENHDEEGIDARVARLHRQLNEYRWEYRHLHTHYEGSLLWRTLPYPIDTTTWSLYNASLWSFAVLFSNQPMYIHGMVELPIEPTRSVRIAVYRLFFYNTPYEAFDVFNTFRFRLMFFQRSERTNVEIQWLELLPHAGSPSLYPDDFGWT